MAQYVEIAGHSGIELIVHFVDQKEVNVKVEPQSKYLIKLSSTASTETWVAMSNLYTLT